MSEVTDNTAIKYREAERILPALMRKMFGNGSLHMDTDTLDLGYSGDYETLSWLSRIVAGFVMEERDIWKPTQQAMAASIHKASERAHMTEHLLSELRKLTDDEENEFDAEAAQALIKRYRTPTEEYYDRRQEMEALRQETVERLEAAEAKRVADEAEESAESPEANKG